MCYKKITCFVLSAFTFTLFCMTSTGFAASDRPQFPGGCRQIGFTFKNDLLVLTPIRGKLSEQNKAAQAAIIAQGKALQTIYLIHNQSMAPMHLTVKKQTNQTFSPTYENTIRAGQWAALAVNQAFMEFICSKPGLHDGMEHAHGEQSSCAQALAVCQYNNAKFAHHNGGTYWVVSSSDRQMAVRGSIRAGILLRW